MRLIDADKLNPDRMTNKGTVAISQSQIAKAPTIQAVPIDVLDNIKAEISKLLDSLDANSAWYRVAIIDCLKVIDKYRKEQE